jgi:hypothetical protein
MRTNGAQRPLLVLSLGSVAAFAVLVGGSRLGGAQPVESCTPKVCSVLFPLHQDGRKMVGSGSAVIFHVPVTVLSVVDGRTRVMVGAHSVGLPVNVAGQADALTVRVQELNDTDATLIFSLTPGERRPGDQAR